MYSIHLNMLNKEIKRFFEKPFPDEFLRINKGTILFFFCTWSIHNGILRTLKSSK